ncbi:hypothetical protein [Lentisalinibacter orientalis]|uniref:hypothetical protein n=1 Tax=Lentisalinibacter orientalis TaxID=2992241 RepID=UPI003865512B
MSVEIMKRIGLGVAAAIGTLFLISALGSLFPPFDVTPRAAILTSAAMIFVAALAGTWVARRNFVAPAVCLSFTLWLFVIYILHSIATVAGQGDFFGIAAQNSLFLLPNVAGALAGAIVGQRLVRHRWRDDQGGPS